MSNKNSEIKKAIDSFDTETARSLLREALKEANAETYYLASLVALDDDQKKTFLQKSLEIDPFHEKSHEALKRFSNVNPISQSSSSEKESVTNSALSPAINANMNQFITATTQGNSDNIPMRVIPIETGLVRTQFKKDTKILLIERDERAEWFLCGYLSPLGQPIIGWLPFNYLMNVSYLSNEVNLLDLPITRFEPYNTRAEVQKLLEEKKKKIRSTGNAVGSTIGSVLGSWVFGFFALIGLLGAVVEESLPLFLLSLIGFVISTGFILRAAKSRKEIDTINSYNVPYKEEIKRLDLLQKDMRSEYERLRDDQRFTMGIQAGLDTAKNLVGIAGNTVASKILTASNQPKDKKK